MARKSEREHQLELELSGKTEAMRVTQAIIRVGIEALSARMLTALALTLDAVLFFWCMVAPEWERLAAAVIFAIASWAVVNYRPPQGGERNEP